MVRLRARIALRLITNSEFDRRIEGNFARRTFMMFRRSKPAFLYNPRSGGHRRHGSEH
jgi:hypothetical protein